MTKAKSRALKSRFDENPFAKKYKGTLAKREESREMKKHMAGIPSNLRRS